MSFCHCFQKYKNLLNLIKSCAKIKIASVKFVNRKVNDFCYQIQGSAHMKFFLDRIGRLKFFLDRDRIGRLNFFFGSDRDPPIRFRSDPIVPTPGYALKSLVFMVLIKKFP